MYRPAQSGDEVASCLAPCIFRLSPLCVSGFPRTPHPAAGSAAKVSSCPDASALRPCRRWIFKSPQISHSFSVAGLCEVPSRPVSSRLLATPAMKASGFPSSLTSGFAGDGSPSCLRVRILRRCRTGRFSSCPEFQSFGIADDSCSGLPRTANPPVPSDGSPSHLGLRTFRLLPVANFQVALNLLSSGPPFNQFPGCPKSWVSRRRRLIDLRVTPNFSPSADPSLLPQVAPILHRRLDR